MEAFNQLTPAEDERLTLLAEECLEVGIAIMKIFRHGYQSTDGGRMPTNNRENLEEEIGHVLHALLRLSQAGDVSQANISRHEAAKAITVLPYVHHQGER